MEPMKPMQPMKPMSPMEPMKPMAPMHSDAWWPKDLGTPSSSGAQNGSRYAYFQNNDRLVVESGGSTKVYDTGGKKIQGFSQQQGTGSGMTFQSDSGPVDLGSLRVLK